MTQEQKRLVVTFIAGVIANALICLGLGHFLHMNPTPVFLGSLGGLAAVLWNSGGRNQWNQLGGLSKSVLFIIMTAVFFAFVALAERHLPGSLFLALVSTGAVVALFPLWWLFSRAMDALWFRISRRR